MHLAEQYRVGQLGHCACNSLDALTGQHSAYGNEIGSGPLCPLNRLIFSSAVSNGFMQYSHAKYLQAAFHENWLDTKGSSFKIVSPFLKLTVENNARPYDNSSNAHVIIMYCNSHLFRQFQNKIHNKPCRKLFETHIQPLFGINLGRNSFVLFKTRGRR